MLGILGKLIDRTLKATRITVELMRNVIVRMVRRVTVFIGITVGLATLDINVGPILAVIGLFHQQNHRSELTCRDSTSTSSSGKQSPGRISRQHT